MFHSPFQVLRHQQLCTLLSVCQLYGDDLNTNILHCTLIEYILTHIRLFAIGIQKNHIATSEVLLTTEMT